MEEMYHSLFIHLSTEGHFVHFQFVAIMNKAAVNIGLQGFFLCKYVFISPWQIPRSGVSGFHGKYILTLKDNYTLNAISVIPDLLCDFGLEVSSKSNFSHTAIHLCLHSRW